MSDVHRTFNKRVAYSIMEDQTDAIILLRSGGKPSGEEDFEEMDKTEHRIVQQFNTFIDRI